MTCRVQSAPFVHHDLDFSQPTPMGFAACRVCGDVVNQDQWAAWPCLGRPSDPTLIPLAPGGVRCALCGEPVQVDPRHRQHVVSFGATCDACYVPLGLRPRRYASDGSGYDILTQTPRRS